MKKLSVIALSVLLLALFAAGCGSSKSAETTAPATTSAAASGETASETPPPINAETAAYLYDMQFSRKQSAEPLVRTVDEFPGLLCEECTFTSNNGQKLAGYKYSKSGLKATGVVVFAHGLGPGGQCIYMDVANYFTSNGFYVFMYDVTGNDKSEGDAIGGMEQGVIDLDYAIRYVEQDSLYKNLPVVLMGHSWGAYCVMAELNVHPEVKAVAELSGFSSTVDSLKSMYAGNLAGIYGKDVSDQFAPLWASLEKERFGKYADYTGLSGAANSKAGIMVIQSSDDKNVPQALGYDLYYAKYKDDPRFTFKLYTNRAHMTIYYTDAARAYFPEANRISAEMAGNSGIENFDKAKAYEVDTQLMDQIRDMFVKYCTQA